MAGARPGKGTSSGERGHEEEEEEGSGGGEGGGGSSVDMYRQLFARLAEQEQERRVDGFGRMTEREVEGLDFLSVEFKKALVQVKGAQNVRFAFEWSCAVLESLLRGGCGCGMKG